MGGRSSLERGAVGGVGGAAGLCRVDRPSIVADYRRVVAVVDDDGHYAVGGDARGVLRTFPAGHKFPARGGAKGGAGGVHPPDRRAAFDAGRLAAVEQPQGRATGAIVGHAANIFAAAGFVRFNGECAPGRRDAL